MEMKNTPKGGLLTLKGMETSRYTVSFLFDASGHVGDFIREGVFSIKSNRKITLDREELASVFYLGFAPLCWILGAEYRSALPVTGSARACLDKLGAYLCHHYGWEQSDPLRHIATISSLRHINTIAPVSHIDTISPPSRKQNKNALLFSGGVDSLSAFFQYRKEIHTLIQLSNFDYVKETLSSAQLNSGLAFGRSFAAGHGKEYLHIETNFAHVITHKALDHYFPGECSFWYGLQHVSHLAVSAAIVGDHFEKVYVAGSNDELHRQVGSCASREEFVNLYAPGYRLCLVEEGVERQRKIEFLADTCPDCLKKLRVCFTSGDPVCCKCVKCLGTALMIIAGDIPLEQTVFPAAICKSLFPILHTLARTENKFILYEQSLSGRSLHGSHADRIVQLFQKVWQTYQRFRGMP